MTQIFIYFFFICSDFSFFADFFAGEKRGSFRQQHKTYHTIPVQTFTFPHPIRIR